jgi:glyoxylase-like metal-dependent hydrolase (beta-lactamase superfamily II)
VDDVPWVESPQRQWREFWGAHPGVLNMAPRRATTLASCGDGIRVDRPLRDGEQLVLGVRRLRVLRTGAHTPGHCAYLDEEAGVLFTGDAVAGRGIPAVSGATVFPPMYDDLDDHVRGLRLLRDLDFDVMCPAHHPPVDRPGGLGLIDDSLALAAEIEALVDGMLPARSRSLATVDVAAAIGRHVGMDPPVSPHTVRTASAHLRAAAARGQLSPAWIGAV